MHQNSSSQEEVRKGVQAVTPSGYKKLKNGSELE